MLIILLLKRKSQGTSSCADNSFQEECWNKTGADSNPGEWGGPCRPGAIFICPRLHSTFMFFCLHPSSEPQISGLGNQTKWPMKHKTRSNYIQWSLSGFMSKRGWTTKHHLVLSKNHTEPPFFFLWFRFENGVSCKACPSFRRVPWQSTGKASAGMDSATLAASVSLRGGSFFSFCPLNTAQVLRNLNHMIIQMTENHKMYW